MANLSETAISTKSLETILQLPFKKTIKYIKLLQKDDAYAFKEVVEKKIDDLESILKKLKKTKDTGEIDEEVEYIFKDSKIEQIILNTKTDLLDLYMVIQKLTKHIESIEKKEAKEEQEQDKREKRNKRQYMDRAEKLLKG